VRKGSDYILDSLVILQTSVYNLEFAFSNV